MLFFCCSKDANVNAVGTDNMTAIIVSLKPGAAPTAPMFKYELDKQTNVERRNLSFYG